jgi:hypothetical protein
VSEYSNSRGVVLNRSPSLRAPIGLSNSGPVRESLNDIRNRARIEADTGSNAMQVAVRRKV